MNVGRNKHLLLWTSLATLVLLGEYEIAIQVHGDVTAMVAVAVIPE